jgi:crossover junction endodeoxyribonuclease RuvC
MIVCGADPGLGGALAFLNSNDLSAVEIFDIPVFQLTRGKKAKRELDLGQLVEIVAAHRTDHAIVEAVASMPKQGLSSTFSFGKTYGALLGILAAHHIPVTLVAAVRWKRALGVPAAKDASRFRATQLLPGAASQWPLAKHHGRAEAALLSLYGARTLDGGGERK